MRKEYSHAIFFWSLYALNFISFLATPFRPKLESKPDSDPHFYSDSYTDSDQRF